MIKTDIKWLYDRFLKIRGTPQEIALGFALGLFIGFSPTMGMQMIIGVLIASVLKWSKIAAVIGVQITNPITAPFIYTFTYFIGSKIMGLEKVFVFKGFSLSSILMMIEQAPRIYTALALGGGLIGLPAAVIGYLIVYRVINRHQERFKEIVSKSSHRIGQRFKRLSLLRKKKEIKK